MKIDEACINHNALRCISEEIGSPYEYAEEDATSDHIRLITLGYVNGVLALADALKEVLKT